MWKMHLLTTLLAAVAALPASAQMVALKAHNGQYVAVDFSYAKYGLKADSDYINGCAVFKMVRFGFGKAAFQAVNKRTITVNRVDLGNELVATNYGIGNWETFKVYELGNNLIALEAANGRFVTPYGKYLELRAVSQLIGPWETFQLVELGPLESPCYQAWYTCTNFAAPFPVAPPGLDRQPVAKIVKDRELDPNALIETPGFQLKELMPVIPATGPLSTEGEIIEKTTVNTDGEPEIARFRRRPNGQLVPLGIRKQ